jgi:hypothetical protein
MDIDKLKSVLAEGWVISVESLNYLGRDGYRAEAVREIGENGEFEFGTGREEYFESEAHDPSQAFNQVVEGLSE